MQSNNAVKFENQSPCSDREQLQSALNNWREVLLRYLRDQMSQVNERCQAAEDGLGIAHRNRGEVAEDVISTLWDQLEEHSTRLCRLARVSDRIQEMELADLITLFSRTTKLNTYPWEGDAWQLPDSIF